MYLVCFIFAHTAFLLFGHIIYLIKRCNFVMYHGPVISHEINHYWKEKKNYKEEKQNWWMLLNWNHLLLPYYWKEKNIYKKEKQNWWMLLNWNNLLLMQSLFKWKYDILDGVNITVRLTKWAAHSFQMVRINLDS